MEQKSLIISLIFGLLIIIFLVFIVVFYFMKKPVQNTIKTKKKTKPVSKKITIEEMVEIAANKNSTKNDLNNAIMDVAKKLPFPKKIKGRLPEKAKVYLNFVLLVASHKQADAKLIAFSNTQLKKANKEYSTEIDIYENEGLRQRANRI